MGELCEVQLRVRMILNDYTFGFFGDSKGYNSAHIRTYIREADTKGLECRPKLASLS